MSYIERVAIIGATGQVGSHLVEALLKSGKQTVTILTRADGNSTPLPGVEVIKVDYEDEDSLVTALTDQQFLAVTASVFTPEAFHARVARAAAKAGVSFLMPNIYSAFDPHVEALMRPGFGDAVARRIEEVEHVGVACIPMVCGFWYEWSLALGEPFYGIDIAKRSVTFFDEGTQRICTSTWRHCGDALAALLSLPVDGASPCISDWRDRPLYIASFRVSQREMLDSLNRVLGCSDAEWSIRYQSSEGRVSEGQRESEAGQMLGSAKRRYSRMFFTNGDGDFSTREELADEVLGLEKEELDEASKRVVAMVESGWNPFAK